MHTDTALVYPVAARLAGDAVTAHADGGHGAHRVEDFVEHGLRRSIEIDVYIMLIW